MSLIDSLKSSVKDDISDKDKKNTLSNLQNSMLILSENLLKDINTNADEYTLRDLKDLSTVIANLEQDTATEDGVGTPESPQAINVYFNKNIESEDKEGYDDSDSNLSKGLDKLSEDEVNELIKNTNQIQNNENYEDGKD